MDSKAQQNIKQGQLTLIRGYSKVIPRRHRVTREAMADRLLHTDKSDLTLGPPLRSNEDSQN